MSEITSHRDKWLVAAWPGMGNVGMIAAGFLVHKLGAKVVGEVAAEGFFDIEQVGVKGGVILPPRLPRSVFHQYLPAEGPELIIFLSEAQPARDGYAFAKKLMDKATELGANRVLTFAAMASQMHPTGKARSFGVVTQPDMKADVTKTGASLLEDGQIGGMNGVILGAAAERGLPGVCLLGEIPFFAAGVANPKAARSVLATFSKLTGIKVDASELSQHDEALERMMTQMLERLKTQGEQDPEEAELPEMIADAEDSEDEEPEVETPGLDAATRERIETLFEEARRDKARGMQLKGELDKLGVFREYENRFLDLYKRAC